MITGVRQFKLINANGTEYDCTRPDALLHAPNGLGWGTERTVERLGLTYVALDEQEIHQSPSGEMIFRSYEEYGRFLTFCQVGGLTLAYKPIDTWYYVKTLISINKSEIEWENNHLICPVQFTLLSYWYERVVAQTAEPPEPAEPNYRTVTGDPAVFNARYSYPIRDLSVAIQGTQELNGYDKPWVGGAGKNLANPENKNTNRFTVDDNGVFTQNTPTSASWAWAYAQSLITVTLDAGTYYVSFFAETVSTNVSAQMQAFSSDDTVLGTTPTRQNTETGGFSITLTEQTTVGIVAKMYDGAWKFQIEKGSTATAYEPYENICPITSYTSVTITQTGSQTNTYEVELTGAGNVYKGTLDVTSGELVVDWAVISSYNGETLPSEWISSGDEYVAGTTPTTGQTVAYELATPLTYQLTPTQLSNLIGQNTIQADAGEVTVTYRTDARTEYKVYPYQYSYTYGNTALNAFDINCDLPSYFKLTIFGEATNPSWRLVVDGEIKFTGKVNASISANQKMVVNTDPKEMEIGRYNKNGTRISSIYQLSDFSTDRIFAVPRGKSQLLVSTEDETQPKVMLEVMKHV